MQTLSGPSSPAADNSMASAGFPDRATVADKIDVLGEADQSFLLLLMENVKQDENLFAGIEFFLNRASAGRFLHTLKLEKAGEWLGNHAPARLQIRLTEIARSSQHPAFTAFRTGVTRSGGLERAYPKAKG